jgi:hypothetical protein
MATAMNPLPSLLRASAWDAGNFSARDAGRKVWNEDDYNAAAETQNRLVRQCYGYPEDTDERMAFIRFQVAGALQAHGRFKLTSDMKEIHALINATMGAYENQPAAFKEAAQRELSL